MAQLSISETYKVLESALRPLSYWYNQDDVEEVAVDHPGSIWLRLRGKREFPWIEQPDPKLTREYLNNILYIIANTYEQSFEPVSGTPVVYATLPGGHRFTGISGRNVMYDNEDLTGGVALAIRVYKEDTGVTFGDFRLSQGERLRPLNKMAQVEDPDDPYDRLLLSIRKGEHILISGGTATGKTTFLNNMIKLVDMHKRILTIEDTRELIIPHPNRVHIVLPRTDQTNGLTYPRVIDLVVRFTPDAIICGEISTSNASAVWELMGSGHENCFATIHAENAEEAYKAFVARIMRTTPMLDRDKTLREMHDKLRVVQINRNGNIRAVTNIT